MMAGNLEIFNVTSGLRGEKSHKFLAVLRDFEEEDAAGVGANQK